MTREFALDYLKTNDITVLNDGKILENRLALAWYPRAKPPEYFRAIIQAVH